ncbi:hypothetical protein L861_16460 [Litchfieldella anticariensis FP35 = DSM 16096]|uniref:Uncharacterized protein n=1 Tax=Litchfieldella anticariensis (strain DSM 16096 / CECT 5854 / CIP 108499 / LMG 22089 / FP35) TaxID=1121939 RepID=S2KI07_LITA3|nr:hypothetical protein L861_16460 [Halomonas anticariensis FP35 = DSM 16096]
MSGVMAVSYWPFYLDSGKIGDFLSPVKIDFYIVKIVIDRAA